MLRVTTIAASGKINFKLEGRLAGNWVDVVENCWSQALAEGEPLAVTVDLSAVSYVDARGTELLRRMHRSGVHMSATTCLGKGIVEQMCSAQPAGERS